MQIFNYFNCRKLGNR
jgi:hypothetical protein